MKRYDSTKIINRFDGKRVYQTTTYPNIIPQSSDLIIITSDAEYLDNLAYKYYGDPSLYWVIALANSIGKGRLSIPVGIQLRIPTNINEILIQFNNLNSNNGNNIG